MSGVSIGIKRFGNVVHISLECQGDYHAIAVYDHLLEGAKRGEVNIGLRTLGAEIVPPIALSSQL